MKVIPFDQLLERIRDIRAGERRMYLRAQEFFALERETHPVLGGVSPSFGPVAYDFSRALAGSKAGTRHFFAALVREAACVAMGKPSLIARSR